MRARARLVAVAAAGAGAVACCPIPIYRTVSVRPALEIAVVDPGGGPVAGAAVTVRRFIAAPGPETERERWTGVTGPDGVLRLDPIEASEPSMPLMMHGVSWHAWEVCASGAAGAGGDTVFADSPTLVGAKSLRVALDPAIPPDCAWAVMAPP